MINSNFNADPDKMAIFGHRWVIEVCNCTVFISQRRAIYQLPCYKTIQDSCDSKLQFVGNMNYIYINK